MQIASVPAATIPAPPKLAAPLDYKEAAVSLCHFSNWTIGNDKIHRLLFLAHVFYQGRYGGRLLEDDFEAWVYGPILSKLRKRLIRFGNRPIDDSLFFLTPVVKDPQQVDVLQAMAQMAAKFSASDLRGITHRPGGAWDRLWQTWNTKGPRIPHNLIAGEYELLFSPKKDNNKISNTH